MAFILGQFKLEEFGLSPECEYASRKLRLLEAEVVHLDNSNMLVESDTLQQTLAAHAKQRSSGTIIDSEVFAEPLLEHATNSFIGSLINRHTPAPKTDTCEDAELQQSVTCTRQHSPVQALATRHPDNGTDPELGDRIIEACKEHEANRQKLPWPQQTLSLKRPAKPPLLFVFKQIVDSAIKAKHDGWHPGIVDEVIRFLKNPDTFMPMMAIDSMRATHIASICSQVVERDPRAQADGQLFYMLLSQNRSQLKHYVGELGL